MKSQLFFVLVPITLSLTEENYPPVYALDIGDGLQIFKRTDPSDCLFWQHRTLQQSLFLTFISGQWKIFQDITIWGRSAYDCYANGGTLLFHQEGKNPYSEGWYDDKNKISNVTMSLYALDECLIYMGAYVNSEFSTTKKLPTGDIKSCTENVFITDLEALHLLTTRSENTSDTVFNSEGENKVQSKNILCRHDTLKSLNGGTLELINDENARILIFGYKKCSSLTSIDISEALTNNENYTAPTTSSKSGEEFQLEVVIGSVAGVVAVLFLVLLLFYCSKCCAKKNKSGEPGHYGRASMDSNLQYGEEKEYYQYQYDQKQTRIVDENELYADYEQ